MHLNAEQVLWALVLAGHLILLIVLLGRDRIHRFPWFTAAITLSVVALLADHLLNGKLATLVFYWQSFSVMTLQAILALFVLIELCRAVFASGRGGRILKANGWLGWGLVTVAIAAGVVWALGPWPTIESLNAQKEVRPILIMQLIASKSTLYLAVLTVEVALLLRIFGRRFGFGWKAHAQQIALGLSTNALCLLTLQILTDVIKRSLHFTTRQQMATELPRLERLFGNLNNARFALWVLVLIWWIVWLWRDDGRGAPDATANVAVPVLTGPPERFAGAEAPLEDSDPAE